MPDQQNPHATGHESVDDAKDRKDADPQASETQQEEGERAQEEAAHDRETQKGYQ